MLAGMLERTCRIRCLRGNQFDLGNPGSGVPAYCGCHLVWQFDEIERFGDEPGGPPFHINPPVFFARQSGQHDYRNVPRGVVVLEFLQGPDAVHLGHGNIQ